jgi:hypothetical protein
MARPRSPRRWLLCELARRRQVLRMLLLLQSLLLEEARVLWLKSGEHRLLLRRPVAFLLLLGRPALLLLARGRAGPHGDLARPRIVDRRPRRLDLPLAAPAPVAAAARGVVDC